MDAWVYWNSFSDTKYPNVVDFGKKASTKYSKMSELKVSYSAAGKSFEGFFKNPDNHVDMFSEIMVPGLDHSIYE